MPVEIQVPLLVKILSFDRNLTSRNPNEMVIGVLYQGNYRASANVADEVRQAVGGLPNTASGLKVRSVVIDLDGASDLAAVLARQYVTVLYVSPLRAVDLAEVTAVTRAQQIRTLTGVPRYVETGLAIGVDLKGGRPEILINLAASRAEGADLNAQLLKLARVIQ